MAWLTVSSTDAEFEFAVGEPLEDNGDDAETLHLNIGRVAGSVRGELASSFLGDIR